ncbi:DNA helicase [Rhizobiales bacterium RZME27]|uniref:DNA helicase n=1 Tax=Endobacterium cereale TaxID=2663029 RepID=A0A6A8AC02_9HYPH|nr:DNA helicase [Endobacterium cereale]MEB2845538.1 DNA helicase [Endobacterium cereale]MQY48833.1 DNA helicase [Endobacterium cereale]
MKLSAPIYQLKREAKDMARLQAIPLHAALDHVAGKEGFVSWSLLAARHASASPAEKLYSHLKDGDFVLIGARPGKGKTLLALELLVNAAKAGRHAVFFTLEYTEKDIVGRFEKLGVKPSDIRNIVFDCSDRISADHIMAAMREAPKGTVAAVDYLQLLDQRRETPPLARQLESLKHFAVERALTLIFISQIDRSYDPLAKVYPDMTDVRLPNPMDLGLFNKACFLNGSGTAQILFQN